MSLKYYQEKITYLCIYTAVNIAHVLPRNVDHGRKRMCDGHESGNQPSASPVLTHKYAPLLAGNLPLEF